MNTPTIARKIPFTVGSLFSGIGGLDLGLQRAGFLITWQVEIDPYCREQVLGQHWPEVPKYADVRTVGTHNLLRVDLLCGGFPCQDISTAGKKAGIAGERSGLWKEFARIIDELRPRSVLIENVAALLYAIKQPDGSRRPAAIATVLRDLAEIGYDAEWSCFRASDVGAPHRRERVFIVAHDPGQSRRISDPSGPPLANPNHDRRGQWTNEHELESRLAASANPGENGKVGQLANPNRARLEIRDWCQSEPTRTRATPDQCGTRSALSRMGGGTDGFPYWLDPTQQRWPAGPGEEQHAWEPPRVVTEKTQDRAKRLKGLGNAALPQIAEALGWYIKAKMESEEMR